MSAISSWIRRNLAGGGDYVARDSLVNKTRREGLGPAAVGAGAGALVGAAGGFAWGLSNLARDTVEIATVREDLTRPVLVGADYDDSWTQLIPNYDGDGNFTGYTHIYHPDDWDPILSSVGTGQQRVHQEFRHSMSFGPVTGALVGLGAGIVVGALVGAVVGRKAEHDPWNPRTPETPEKQQLARMADRAPLVGVAAGAALGAGAGALAGWVSQGKAQVLDQVVAEPVYRRELLGYIPHTSDRIPREHFQSGGRIYYDEFPGGGRSFEGKEAVYREVFTGEFRDVHKTEVSHRLTPATGALIGMGAGALVGIAAGVATGVLMKAAAGEDPPGRW